MRRKNADEGEEGHLKVNVILIALLILALALYFNEGKQ